MPEPKPLHSQLDQAYRQGFEAGVKQCLMILDLRMKETDEAIRRGLPVPATESNEMPIDEVMG